MSFVANQIREFGFIHGLLDDAADEIESLEAQLASAPAWHDAPTVPGLWVQRCNLGAALEYVRQEDLSSLIWSGRWYGPISPDTGNKS